MSARFNWDDPFLLEEKLGDAERLVRDSARRYCQEQRLPRVRDAHRHERFDREILLQMGARWACWALPWRATAAPA